MAPVTQCLGTLLRKAEEMFGSGASPSDDGGAFCVEMDREFAALKTGYKYFDTEPHSWALKAVKEQIDWMCSTDGADKLKVQSPEERRAAFQERIANLKEVMETYIGSATCQPGDVEKCA